MIPFGVSAALIVIIDILTNGITRELLFDSNVYIGMAERGFAPELRISPFIYRFIPPLLAGSLHHITDLSIYKSFKVISYIGAVGQLLGVFLLVKHLTKSEKSAYVGMLSVALSMYNLKYPLFDVYRPDILAYPIILLATWFAFRDYFFPLLITTMIGLQFREFTIAPLLAYLAARLQHEMSGRTVRDIAVSMIGLSIAIGLPRLLIPAIEHAEAVQLSAAGIGQMVQLLSVWPRNINIVYIVLGYFLPLLILFRPSQFRGVLEELPGEQVRYLAYYSAIVLLLVMIGGTDLERFATYFFLPLAVLTGLLAKDRAWIKILLVLALQFIFNRIWLPFPVWDFDSMVNFYAGWANVINTASLWRFAELIALAVIGNILVHFELSSRQKGILEARE
ncbi:MAG TPA: hypothetical protein VFO91_12995 [Anaerolineales bacterium]|nr:hypothetical protein [Anaerolineales bacterium]